LTDADSSRFDFVSLAFGSVGYRHVGILWRSGRLRHLVTVRSHVLRIVFSAWCSLVRVGTRSHGYGLSLRLTLLVLACNQERRAVVC